MYLSPVILLFLATLTLSSDTVNPNEFQFGRIKRASIIGSFLGKWCRWGEWSPCDSHSGERIDEDNQCFIKSFSRRNRTCTCPKPSFAFLSKCRKKKGIEIKQCRIPCIPETNGISIPSFYIFLIISVSCILIVGFFTCLFSALRICHRRHQSRLCCLRPISSPVPRRIDWEHRYAINRRDEAMRISDDPANNLPPDYDAVVAEDRLKMRANTPPPIYEALFRSHEGQLSADGSAGRDEERSSMLEASGNGQGKETRRNGEDSSRNSSPTVDLNLRH